MKIPRSPHPKIFIKDGKRTVYSVGKGYFEKHGLPYLLAILFGGNVKRQYSLSFCEASKSVAEPTREVMGFWA